MFRVEDGRTLASLFHLNSEPWMNAKAYAEESYDVQYKEMPTVEGGISLPKATAMDGLRSLAAKRCSSRSFSSREMPLELLAEILETAYGPLRVVQFANGLEVEARAVPSAGGLFPLELYVLARNVSCLRDGLYHYNIRHHCLEPLRHDVTQGRISEFLLAQPFVDQANMVIMIGAVFDRTLHKYGPRGYRYVLLEAGHLAQTLCLLATERDLGSLCIGGFMDTKANNFAGLDGVNEAVVYMVGIGYRA